MLDTPAAERELVVTRRFDAPRALVFDAFVDPAHVAHWWGPHGFTTTTAEMDVRPGGVWRHTMRGPDGAAYPGVLVYREVVRPERLVWDQHGADASPPTLRATVTFAERDGGTEVVLRLRFPSAEARAAMRDAGVVGGAEQMLERFGAHLAARPAAR